MRTYARIHENKVAELFTTTQGMGDLFSPMLVWVDVTGSPDVMVGWNYADGQFTPPAPIAPPPSASLAQLQAQLASLAQQVAAFAKTT